MATARVAYSGRFLYGHMSSHVTFAVPVGVGVVWRRVGTLASPSVPEPPHADKIPSWPGRRKRPHSTQHRPRPYADNERDMARHVAAQKLTAVSDPRRRPENLTITRTAHSDDQ